ncbi:tyrosine-type recombinase/integrase [Enterocloster lavalensis]|uniref:tyrosine-type recombinase/integrase n=1 Tax=Enterocloster lavalensis TaxID=460384 RepID=UPI0034A198CC
MAEQVRVDEVVTTIMYGLAQVIAAEAKSEQERMNEAQQVLYMTLCHMRMYVEETALSTQLDNSAEWVRLFLATMVIRGCTEKTVESYRQEYTTFFGTINKAIPDITTGDIRGYLAHCKLVRKNKDVTINNKTRMLRGLFTWLTEEEYIERNPMLRIKDNKVEHRVKEVFSDEQITMIKDAAMRHGPRSIAIVDFLHRTGVRISEMVALDRTDIDFQDRQCIVYGKGRKERPVYFSGDAAVHLKEYLESRTDDNPALFVGGRYTPRRLTDDGVRLILREIWDMDDRLAGVAINPHKWRRQFVTDLLEKDVPLTLVADLVGHANLNTTKDNYGNYSRNKAREAHRKFVSG